MDRLTRWNGKKYVLPQGYGAWREIAERLAAYENTGLKPEEIEAMKRATPAAGVMDGYDREGYYVADVNGVAITFVSYEEYIEYINSEQVA